jgi:hypothetical protein
VSLALALHSVWSTRFEVFDKQRKAVGIPPVPPREAARRFSVPGFGRAIFRFTYTRPELLRPSVAQRRWIDRRRLQAVQLLSVQLSGDVAS